VLEIPLASLSPFEKRGKIQEQPSKFKVFILNPVRDGMFLEKQTQKR